MTFSGGLWGSYEIMKFRQIGPPIPGKTVIFGGVKSFVPSSTVKMRKSKKKISLKSTLYTRYNILPAQTRVIYKDLEKLKW